MTCKPFLISTTKYLDAFTEIALRNCISFKRHLYLFQSSFLLFC